MNTDKLLMNLPVGVRSRIETAVDTVGVDTAEDLERVRRLMTAGVSS